MSLCLSCPSRNLDNTCRRAVMLGLKVKEADCNHFICLRKQSSGNSNVRKQSSGD